MLAGFCSDSGLGLDELASHSLIQPPVCSSEISYLFNSIFLLLLLFFFNSIFFNTSLYSKYSGPGHVCVSRFQDGLAAPWRPSHHTSRQIYNYYVCHLRTVWSYICAKWFNYRTTLHYIWDRPPSCIIKFLLGNDKYKYCRMSLYVYECIRVG